ncbi:MAG: carbohydrate ABC transporter permease [Clostridiales bacterium]|jgi:putative aldouronate transport system permease protein|nr:carbohydrate ABC transporter permease [Clostridiales bacterium]
MNLSLKGRSAVDKTVLIIFNILLVFAAVVVIYPLYFVLIASVSSPDAVNSGRALFLPSETTLVGYKYIFRDWRIWIGYRNTILYTVCGTALGLLLTVMGGYSLSRRDLPGRKIITTIFIITMYFGGGLIPTYLVIQNLHLINTPYVLMILGSFSTFSLIVTRTFFSSKIPYELLEAASIDGCGNARFFVSIVLPLSKEILSVIALQYAVGHWNSFFNALIYVNDVQFYPLQLFLRDMLISAQSGAADALNYDAMLELKQVADTMKYGIIIVSSLPVLILYPFLQKYFVHGIMIGSLKG